MLKYSKARQQHDRTQLTCDSDLKRLGLILLSLAPATFDSCFASGEWHSRLSHNSLPHFFNGQHHQLVLYFIFNDSAGLRMPSSVQARSTLDSMSFMFKVASTPQSCCIDLQDCLVGNPAIQADAARLQTKQRPGKVKIINIMICEHQFFLARSCCNMSGAPLGS